MILEDERQRNALQRRAEAAFKAVGSNPTFDWTIDEDGIILCVGAWSLSEDPNGVFKVETSVAVPGGREVPDSADLVEVKSTRDLRDAENAMYLGHAMNRIEGAVQMVNEVMAYEEEDAMNSSMSP